MAFNSPRMGSLMDPLGRIMQPNGTAVPQTVNSQQSLGSMAMPPMQSEPPVPPNSEEFQQRVKRNQSFLQQPEISAALLQFGMSLMSGGDIGSAMTEGVQAAGRYSQNQDNQALIDRKMNLEERGMNINEDELTLKEAEFKLKAKQMGGRTYSKLVSGDSPIGIELGLAKGERARVKFVEDRDGNIINADMEANPLESGGAGKGTQVTQYLNEAAIADAAGDTERAKMLRTAAEKAATGKTTALTLEPGQTTQMIDGVETAVWLPGTKGYIKQQEDKKAEAGKNIQEIQTGVSVRKAVNSSLQRILSSNLPPDLVLTGFGSYISYLRGTGANDLAGDLDTVKANLGFMKLQDIREGSKTGGALGPVSDFENRLLQATVANLENSHRAEYLVDKLLHVKAIFTDVEYTGQLTRIGQQLERGEINTAQAVNMAGDYLDKAVADMKAAQTGAQKDLSETPPPVTPPKDAGEGYHYLTPDKQQRMQQLLDKKNSREK